MTLLLVKYPDFSRSPNQVEEAIVTIVISNRDFDNMRLFG